MIIFCYKYIVLFSFVQYQEESTNAHQDSTSLDECEDDTSINAGSRFSSTEDASCSMIEKEGKKERKNAVCVPRWKWTEEKLDALVSCLYDDKIQKDFDGKDMESDLIQLYEDIRKMMARMFPGEEFGPEATTIIPSEISESERALLQRDIVIENKEIKVGYNRIKYRVKQLRQNFKKAVVDGTRSGSGRLIIENWDHLVSIWGGCPSVNQIKGAVVSSPDNEIMDSRMDRDIDSSEQEMESNVQPEIDEFDLTEEEESLCQRKRKKTQESAVDEPKKIKVSENKRRKLDKPLSA